MISPTALPGRSLMAIFFYVLYGVIRAAVLDGIIKA